GRTVSWSRSTSIPSAPSATASNPSFRNSSPPWRTRYGRSRGPWTARCDEAEETRDSHHGGTVRRGDPEDRDHHADLHDRDDRPLRILLGLRGVRVPPHRKLRGGDRLLLEVRPRGRRAETGPRSHRALRL